jgi:hypothetical protein
MNRRPTLSLLLLLFSISTFAQDLTFSPKVGFNRATVSNPGFVEYLRTSPGSDQPVTVVSPYGARDLPSSGPSLTREPSSISSFQVGFGVEKKLNQTFSVETGLSYTQKGFRTYTPNKPGLSFFKDGAPSTQKAEYLEVPFMARITLGASRVRWFANAGPYAAYWLRYTFVSDVTSPLLSTRVDLTNQDFQRLDLGLAAGVGLRMKAGAGELVTEVRYAAGWRDQQKDIVMPNGNAPVQNRAASLLVGYAIPLSGQQ